jgi:TonB family protein
MPTPVPRPLPPAGEAPVRFALAAKPLMALTQDEELLAALRNVTDPVHEVCVIGAELDLSTALMTHHAGVAVLDSSLVVSPLATLTARLHAQFPEVVLIVAGGASEQGVLAAQITDGSVHRFLHKPVSEQRVRAFVESAWRRQAHDATATMLRPPPARPRAARALRIAAAVLAALAALAVPLVWIATRTAPVSPVVTPPAPERNDQVAAVTTATSAASSPDVPATPGFGVPAGAGVTPPVAPGVSGPAAPAATVPGLPNDAAPGGQPAAAAAAASQEPAQPQLDAQVSDFLQRAATAMSRGAFIEPRDDNARFYLESARALAPQDERVQEAMLDLVARLESEARQALAAHDPAQAEAWTAAAAEAGAQPEQVAALRSQAQALRGDTHDAAAIGAPVAATVAAPGSAPAAALAAPAADASDATLTRTRYVPPVYPDSARNRNIGGWVDLTFLVGPDGTVREVAVVGAQPPGTFEQAALDAVRHWRYQPVVRDGHAASQQARVRVRFKVHE